MKRTSILKSAAFIFGTMLLASCSEMFENRIGIDLKSDYVNLSDLVVPPAEITGLDAPAQIFVSKSDSPDRLNVSWSPVNFAVSYKLERAVIKPNLDGTYREPTDEDFTSVPLASKWYQTQFTDVVLTDPTYKNEEYSYRYFYRVCAENSRLKYDSSAFTTSDAGYLLAPPQNVKASLGDSSDSITLTWDKALEAKSYDIYRTALSDGSSAIKIGNVNANQNSFVNKVSTSEQGKEFYYTIITRTNTSSSVSSSIALGYSLLPGAPSQVQNVRVKESRGDSIDAIKIEWDAVSIAGSDTLYSVYRTSSIDASYTLLKKDLKNETSYEDKKSLESGVFYYYQVQAYTNTGGDDGQTTVKGPFSASSKNDKNPCEGYILAPPAEINVMKTSTGTACDIKITPAIGSKDSPIEAAVKDYKQFAYVICTSDTQNGTFTEGASYSENSLSLGEDGFYTIKDVPLSKFYKVLTMNDAGTKSSMSSVCSPVPFAPLNMTVTKAGYIAGVTDNDSTANEAGVHAVKISWNPPAANDAEGGYNIYRSTKYDSGFKKLNESPLTATYYIDSNEAAKAGVYYYYKVVSLNSLGQGANYTPVDYGYGALTAEQYMREYNQTIKRSHKRLTLMHKSAMSKLGEETVYGAEGSLYYNAKTKNVTYGDVTMHYQNYVEYYVEYYDINGTKINAPYFKCDGYTNTFSDLSSGSMNGTNNCTGMYPGSVGYDDVKIVNQAAGGGTYKIHRDGFPKDINVSWKIGEE